MRLRPCPARGHRARGHPRNKLGAAATVEYAAGVRRSGETIPSMFDDHARRSKPPGSRSRGRGRVRSRPCEPAAAARRWSMLVLGERPDMSGEVASRASLDLPGRQQELLEAVVGAGQARGARAGQRPPAEHHLGGRARARDPRGLVAGHRGRQRRRRRAVRRRQPRRQAAGHLAAHAGQVPVYYAHNLTHQPETARRLHLALLGRAQHAALSVRLRPELHELRLLEPEARAADDGEGRRHRRACRCDVARTPARRAGDEVVQLYIHQQAGSASRPVRELKGFRARRPGAGREADGHVPARPERAALLERGRAGSGCRRRRTFDVWVGTDSNARLHSTFKIVP